MASVDNTAEDLKIQAKRLRQYLENNKIKISHSEALEAIAATNGFKDWNTASAATGSAKFYVLNCYADGDQEDPDLTATFQYVVRAKDTDHAIESLTDHLTGISGPTKSGFFPTEFFTTDIVEIDLPVGQGISLNMCVDYSENITTLPYGGRKGVEIQRADDSAPGPRESDEIDQVVVLEELQRFDSAWGIARANDEENEEQQP